METLKEIQVELNKIVTNFGKSRNRPYSEKTLQEKEEKTKQLLSEAKDCVSVPTDVETVLKYKTVYLEIKQLVDNILGQIAAQRRNDTMTFDLKSATALVQNFSGNYEDAEAFIEALELLNEMTPAEHKDVMVKFIKTRITGKAKQALPSNVTTVEQIIAKIKEKFSAKPSKVLLAKLKTCKQGNRKLEDFTNQLEELTRQLSKAFVAEKLATSATADKLAENFAIDSLIDNIANPDTQIVLKSSELQTLSELTTKALTVDKPQTGNVLQ